MTVELEKNPLAGGINLNSSYTIHEFRDFGGVTPKTSSPKKVSISKKGNFGSVQNIEERGNMSGKYSDDDYDSYDEDFENSTPEPRNSSRYSRARSRSPVPKKSSSRAMASRTRGRRDSLASYRSAYGTQSYSRGNTRMAFIPTLLVKNFVYRMSANV